MGDIENAQARKEAVEAAAKAGSGANRQRLWAGMNRYLAAETEHAHRTSEQEEKDEATGRSEDPGPESPDPGPDPDPA